MELYNFLSEYITEGILVITNILAFFVGIRKRKASDEQSENLATKGELENVQGALKMYREIMGDLKGQLEDAAETYKHLEEAFEEIVKKEKACRKENESLNDIITKLKKVKK